jgi:hypothetical protein
VPGNSCADPQTATLGDNSGDSSSLEDWYGIDGCNNIGGNDEVWEFDVPSDACYEVIMDTDGGFDAVVMIWPDECGSDSSWICGNPDPDSDVASAEFCAFAGETIYILADSDDDGNGGGGYTLTINELPPPDPGDHCLDPFTAELDTVHSGDTTMAEPDYQASCDPNDSGPDQVWEFTATTDGWVDIVMDTTVDTEFQCTLAVRTDCDDIDTEVVCDNDWYSQDGICNLYMEVQAGEWTVAATSC